MSKTKRLIIVVEGETEEEFVNRILKPYFASKNIFNVKCFKIKHSRGGLSKYSHFRRDILKCIYQQDAVVTSLIDFYALPTDFPEYEKAKQEMDKNKQVQILEQEIKKEIEKSQKQEFNNFIPYIQLHEFEALIFSSINGFDGFEKNKIDIENIEKILKNYANPEDINDNKSTAPSKRLLKHIKGYNKIVDGNMMIQKIGIDVVIKKCKRFSGWLDKIIKSMEVS